MTSQKPKNNREKRLHVLYFTDASKTTSASIRYPYLIVGISVFFLILITSAASIYCYSSLHREFNKQKLYTNVLKSGLIAQVLVSQQSISEKLLSNEDTLPLTLKVLEEVKNNPVLIKKPLQTHVKNLEGALKTSLNNQNSEKNQPIDFSPAPNAKVLFRPNSEPLPIPSKVALNEKPVLPSGPKMESGVRFSDFSVSVLEGEPMLNFKLVNTHQDSVKSIFGHVCAVIELKDEVTANATDSTSEKWLTIPSNLPLNSRHKLVGPCHKGQVVRFARLRPTSLELPASLENIAKITLSFSDLPGEVVTESIINDVNDL